MGALSIVFVVSAIDFTRRVIKGFNRNNKVLEGSLLNKENMRLLKGYAFQMMYLTLAISPFWYISLVLYIVDISETASWVRHEINTRESEDAEMIRESIRGIYTRTGVDTEGFTVTLGTILTSVPYILTVVVSLLVR